jgi:hypothetical protein
MFKLVRNINNHAHIFFEENSTNLPPQEFWRRILFSSLGSDSFIVELK